MGDEGAESIGIALAQLKNLLSLELIIHANNIGIKGI